MQTEPKFRTLIDLFNQSLVGIEQLDKECLEIIRADRQESLTFGRLRARARDFAVWLIQVGGIRVGNRVAILGKNRVDWDVALWGVVLAGGIPVLIDPERPVEGVADHITHTEARLIVMADDYHDAESRRELKEFASGRDIGLIEMTVHEKIGLNRVEAGELLDTIRPQIQPEDTAVILCTSGTTGDPREVELTHANLGANLQGTVKKVNISHEDTLGHMLPPHHSFGLTVGKLLPFCVGAANVYTNKYREVAELIRDKNVTIFIAVPALFTTCRDRWEKES
jgi:long-chain acyl-CoA synthetase